MTIIEKIKAEVEKRLKNTRDYMNGAGMKYKGPKYHASRGRESAYDAILSFLSTLESGKPIYSFDELDHEADDWIGVLRSDSGTNNDWNIGDIYRTVQHFAKWGAERQKEQDRLEIANIKAKTWCEGFDACKEQMLKEAVDADVNIYRDLAAGKSWAEFIVEMPTNNLGDKVRIIIVKED